ncbi:hypothetical protein [Streptomyces natalensis]|uniref:Uncharacterized protein n=1 Tax=Streptomyces natalensis ATCC 27448 TaxID=1240678 RepID=A0A0D7CK27_9ACTN|nr:hypothetical protein [Streptomyces natalensis]KIZ16426.1 hypothetical protein SNA_20530 [Streptomyces natalensis ATCC 27448]
MSGLFDLPEPRRVSLGEYPLWDEALALVNRDLAVTLPDQGLLQLLGLPSYDEDVAEYVYVALANGEWHGNVVDPHSADNPLLALTAITDAAQETVTECLWQTWPVCDEHDLGMHPREAAGQLSWWCAGGNIPSEPGHIRAAVGGLASLVHPARPHRKRRREG